MTSSRRMYRGGAPKEGEKEASSSSPDAAQAPGFMDGVWKVVGETWFDKAVWALMLLHVGWSVAVFVWGNAYFRNALNTQNRSSTDSVLKVQAARNQARLLMLRMFLSAGIWVSYSVLRFFFHASAIEQCSKWIFLLYGAIYLMQTLALAMLVKPWDTVNKGMRGTTFSLDSLLMGATVVAAFREFIPFLNPSATAPAAKE